MRFRRLLASVLASALFVMLAGSPSALAAGPGSVSTPYPVGSGWDIVTTSITTSGCTTYIYTGTHVAPVSVPSTGQELAYQRSGCAGVPSGHAYFLTKAGIGGNDAPSYCQSYFGCQLNITPSAGAQSVTMNWNINWELWLNLTGSTCNGGYAYGSILLVANVFDLSVFNGPGSTTNPSAYVFYPDVATQVSSHSIGGSCQTYIMTGGGSYSTKLIGTFTAGTRYGADTYLETNTTAITANVDTTATAVWYANAYLTSVTWT